MQRRRFNLLLVGSISTAVTTADGANASEAQRPKTNRTSKRKRLRPKRLRAGDAVALIASGGYVTDAMIETAFRNMESLGLKPRLAKNVRAQRGGYAGTPAQRAEDFHEMWNAQEIRALWSIRGGSGTAQILPLIDYAALRRDPKVLVGFSDMTALLNAVTHVADIVTFHGPAAISTFSDYSKAHLQNVLFEGVANYTMRTAPANDERAVTEPEFVARTLREGVAEGELIGGNLAVFSALIGTPYLPISFANKLLFLEEINEAPYRIDRMLTQIRQYIGRRSPSATLFGVCRKCEATDGEPSLTLSEVLQDHANAQPIPTVAGYSFGHIAHQMTLPIGVNARLDSRQQTVTLLEAAVH
jgi:muramoyltetrapeptide carboxypeptidase